MAMYFHGGVSEVILFSCWKINTVGGLVASCLGLFLIAVLYEGLKVAREILQRRQAACICGPTEEQLTHRCNLGHLVQSLLHMLQLTISYLLMLIFMTYNVWLCAAVVLGAGVGYFLFAHYRPASPTGAPTPSLSAFADHCN